ncbi:MAG: hypothetical protein ACR2HN_11315 [Tepidiformaceae bacterium]
MTALAERWGDFHGAYEECTVICAWCERVLVTGGSIVSYGVCPGCAQRSPSRLYQN